MIPELYAVQQFLMWGGGGLVATELLCTILKNRKKKTTNLAKGKLIKDLGKFEGEDGIILAKGVQLLEKISKEHIVVLGPTGAGKSSTIFIPNLLSPNLKGSFVVLDAKGELYNITSNYQRKLGRKVIVFSPLNPTESFCYNPLELCKDNTEVTMLAQTILLNGAKSLENQTGVKAGGTEWLQMAQGLFCAALLYCKHKGDSFGTISNAIRLIINNSTDNLDKLFTNSTEDVKEQWNSFKLSCGAEGLRDSIRTTLIANTTMWLDKNIEKITCKTSFKAEDLRKEDTVLYINYAEVDADYLSPLLAVFYSQFLRHLAKYKTNKQIYCLFDEFANCSVISSFSKLITTARSQDIAFLICLQSLSQLEENYGKYNAQTIWGNLNTKCILPGLSDPYTLKCVEDLINKQEATVENISIDKEGNLSSSYNTSTKKLINYEDIRTLNDDEILIISKNKMPMLAKQNPYYMKKEYLERAI